MISTDLTNIEGTQKRTSFKLELNCPTGCQYLRMSLSCQNYLTKTTVLQFSLDHLQMTSQMIINQGTSTELLLKYKISIYLLWVEPSTDHTDYDGKLWQPCDVDVYNGCQIRQTFCLIAFQHLHANNRKAPLLFYQTIYRSQMIQRYGQVLKSPAASVKFRALEIEDHLV
ncbi:UNKNOWN [Stylonychia lemnae]|uniref:Uncharacterized protein n=1 Tax=Stylonychia lemnae TaxID=5949 RepID=A0A078B4S4_STYLE|nr:UNKNOWN [Stylonychia lemnae]|eukprot:CDW88227.1 UNKNOWN [Stylonychia lemnae]